MNISLLVAYSLPTRVIGSLGKIPWNLPNERTFFKQTCNNKYIIMGRKTFEEIGHALSYCKIIIISNKLKNNISGCLVFSNLDKAINFVIETQQNKEEEILICGGQSLYEQTLPLANKIYATQIMQNFNGDRFFPKIDETEWNKLIIEKKEENNIKYDYVIYERKKKI